MKECKDIAKVLVGKNASNDSRHTCIDSPGDVQDEEKLPRKVSRQVIYMA